MRKQNSCEFETEIINFIKSASKDSQISNHLQSCADCRETAKVVGFFQTEASRRIVPKTLPTAGLIWWKSYLLKKRRAAEKVAQPIFIVQTAAAAAPLITTIGLFVYRPEFFSPIYKVLSQTLNAVEQIAFPLIAGLAAFAIISAAVIFTMRRWVS